MTATDRPAPNRPSEDSSYQHRKGLEYDEWGNETKVEMYEAHFCRSKAFELSEKKPMQKTPGTPRNAA
jgi:hypothetical protein